MRSRWTVPALAGFALLVVMASVHSFAQSAKGPAFVIIERLATTGPESIQEEYRKMSRDIVAKFGGRYLARSQQNTLLEADSNVPCCMAIISFFRMRRPPKAGLIRRRTRTPPSSGAAFRIVSVQGGCPDRAASRPRRG
jgi:Domain of unknown function (DUF1330)